jgi:hypothetical protein
MKTFSIGEMENIFEIGRIIQFMLDKEMIDIDDSKNAFMYALNLAIEFEKEYSETEEYYSDIQEFVVEKLKAEFGFEN